ncbi:MAG: hypothetical protein HC898_03795 [Phycisphaerales bacterium]|nr:hypothetical protein [Phycisphaerales bacterium]
MAGLLLGALSFSVGCESSHTVDKGSSQAPVASKTETKAAPASVPAGMVKSSAAFPTGKLDSSVIQLERTMPAELSVGQEI